MKQKRIVLVLFFLSSLLIVAQQIENKQKAISRGKDEIKLQTPVHQTLVRDAYDLLLIHIPAIENTIMNEHIGTNEWNGYPWSTQKVVAGAYNEDIHDIVYGHDFEPYVTINHFGDADAGDNSKMNNTLGSFYNAYQKARVYIYGSDVNGHKRIYISANLEDQGQCGVSSAIGWYMSYTSLFDFYKTGKYYWEGYNPGADTNPVYRHCGPYYMNVSQRNKYVWEILGRVAHLLGDMGVPAHVHNDMHVAPDSYEDQFMSQGVAANFNENMVYHQIIQIHLIQQLR